MVRCEWRGLRRARRRWVAAPLSAGAQPSFAGGTAKAERSVVNDEFDPVLAGLAVVEKGVDVGRKVVVVLKQKSVGGIGVQLDFGVWNEAG